jgi:hypothetical protein
VRREPEDLDSASLARMGLASEYQGGWLGFARWPLASRAFIVTDPGNPVPVLYPLVLLCTGWESARL